MILKLCVLNVMFSILCAIIEAYIDWKVKDAWGYMECKNLLYDADIYEGGLFASPTKASSWFDYLFGQNWYSRLGIGITGFILFFVLYIYG